MPFALLTIGLILVAAGFQNTYAQLGEQVVKDFSGKDSFFKWLIALGVIGGLGYIKSLEGFSRIFLVLIIVAILLSNKGFFAQFQQQVEEGSTSKTNPIGAPLPEASGGGSSKKGGGLSSIAGIAGAAIKIGGLFSDERLKENAQFVGIENGVPIYDFNYKGDAQRYRGTIANEVKHTGAVTVDPATGYKKVNYRRLGIPFTKSPG